MLDISWVPPVKPRSWSAGRILQVLLCTVALLHTPENYHDGLAWGTRHRQAWESFHRDLLAGMPPGFLLRRYDWLLPRWRESDFSAGNFQYAEACMQLLRQAGIGDFGALRELPRFREISVPVVPTALHEMTWQGDTGHGFGTDPYVEFRLPPAPRVYGILIRCSLNYGSADPAPVAFGVSWHEIGAPDFTNDPGDFRLDTGSAEKDVGVWVNRPIDRLRIRPDSKPCVLHLSKLVLLVPVS